MENVPNLSCVLVTLVTKDPYVNNVSKQPSLASQTSLCYLDLFCIVLLTTACTVNTWGPGCNNTCQCKNNATCDMRNGSCSCAPGWIGDTCQSACQQGFYGDKCLLKCACQNGASCHHVTGTCSCQEGYIGERYDRLTD